MISLRAYWIQGLAALTVVTAVALVRRDPDGVGVASVATAVRRSTLFYMVGMLGAFGGLAHLLKPKETAASQGWPDSGFQFEVGLCNIALAVLGVGSVFLDSRGFTLATVTYASIFLGGAGLHHFYTRSNQALGNSGPVMYSDLLTPIVLIVSFVLSDRQARKTRSE